MFGYYKALLGVWAALVSKLIWARLPDGTLNMDALLDALVPTASDGWLMATYGLGIGLFVIPWFINWIERGREYERFYERLGEESLARARTAYFKYLSRGFEKWKTAQNQNIDETSLQDAIKCAKFPQWLPVTSGELVNKIKQEYGTNAPTLWRFCDEFCREIDSFIRFGKPPTLISEKDADEFQDARQKLSYFWDYTAIMLLRYRKLRFRNLKADVEAEEALIKSLTFVMLGLNKALNLPGLGAKHFYYLSAISFGNGKWGVREWLWNPLLSASENLRT